MSSPSRTARSASGGKRIVLICVAVALFCIGTNIPISKHLVITENYSAVLRLPATIQYVDPETKWWRGQGENPNATHPHLGARIKSRDGNESLQMIVEPTTQRLEKFPEWPYWAEKVACPPERIGIEQERGNEALLKIKNGIQTYNKHPPRRGSKILCMVYTIDTPTARANLLAQVQTWGKKCDGFFAASNTTDHTLGAIDLVHAGPEEYSNMWQKVRSMWAYAYDHYLDSYDFFHICGDDVYIVMENLRAFLDGPQVLALEDGHLDSMHSDPNYIEDAQKWLNISQKTGTGRPLYFGLPRRNNGIWPLGGPGYTLNRAALEVIGRLRLDSFKANVTTSREDFAMGSMFNSLGILLHHTFDGTGHRYWGSARQGATPHKGPGQKPLFKRYGIMPKDSLEGLSEGMASMHLRDDKPFLKENNRTMAELIYRYHAILYGYGSCNDETEIKQHGSLEPK